jgi:hypothetical protein
MPCFETLLGAHCHSFRKIRFVARRDSFNEGAKFVQQLPNSAVSLVVPTDDYLIGDGRSVFAHRINRLNFSRQKE